MISLQRARWLGQALAVLLSLTVIASEAWSQGAMADVSGKVVRITKKRTAFLVSLSGNQSVAKGAEVELAIPYKKKDGSSAIFKRSGKIIKVIKNGRALVKLNETLPKRVRRGDELNLKVATAASVEGSTRLRVGGFLKTNWSEVSFLAMHRAVGLRADIEANVEGGTGNRKSKGGNTSDDINYEAKTKLVGGKVALGYVGFSGIGGGIWATTRKRTDDSSAEINTASTGTLDHDASKKTETVTDFTPYVALLSRARSADLSFGAALGYQVRTTKFKLDETIADASATVSDTKATESGITLELSTGTATSNYVLRLTPASSGEYKTEAGQKYDRKASEYGFLYECYSSGTHGRLGFFVISASDDFKTGTRKDSSYRIVSGLDGTLGPLGLAPYLNYGWGTLTLGTREAKTSQLDIGSRFVWPAMYAPFIGLGYQYRSGEEKGGTLPKTTTETSSYVASLGLTI